MGVSIDPRTVRASPIAGTWYPGSKRELANTVDAMLAAATYFPTGDDILGLVAPHAGYAYSGATAAYAYRQITGQPYELVVLLGPSHYQDYGAFAVSAKQYYATPLGAVELDEDFIARLGSRIPLTRVDDDQEHSLEIQLPFMQRVLGTFKLAPIMMSLPFYLVGPEALAPCEELAGALADLAQGQRILFVASSDLSHLADYDAVDKYDARTEDLMDAFDIPGLVHYMWQAYECRACGDAPIITMLLAAKQLGAQRARVLYRTNSGDVTGERGRGRYTVGYMAAAVYKPREDGGRNIQDPAVPRPSPSP